MFCLPLHRHNPNIYHLRSQRRPLPTASTDEGFVVQANMDAWRDDDLSVRVDALRAANSATATATEVEAELDPGEHDWQDICTSRYRRRLARTAIHHLQKRQGKVSGFDAG